MTYPDPPVALRDNEGKPELGRLLEMPEALADLAAVLKRGADKYSEGNYLLGGKPDAEYLDAALRHMAAHKRGVLLREEGGIYDDETGCKHMAHAAWNCLALLQCNTPPLPPENPHA